MNEDKTEVLLVIPKRVVKSELFPEFMNISGTSFKFRPSLRNLEVTLDTTLSLHQHVLNICRSAFLELRRNFLTTDVVKTLFVHWFCHVLTTTILYLQVYLSFSLRRYNMCTMLQQNDCSGTKI